MARRTFRRGHQAFADAPLVALAREHVGREVRNQPGLRGGYAHLESQILSGLMPWEDEFYSRFLKGYRVEGLEGAPRAAALARAMLAKHGLVAPVATGRIEDAPLGKPFDAYVFSWCCY